MVESAGTAAAAAAGTSINMGITKPSREMEKEASGRFLFLDGSSNRIGYGNSSRNEQKGEGCQKNVAQKRKDENENSFLFLSVLTFIIMYFLLHFSPIFLRIFSFHVRHIVITWERLGPWRGAIDFDFDFHFHLIERWMDGRMEWILNKGYLSVI